MSKAINDPGIKPALERSAINDPGIKPLAFNAEESIEEPEGEEQDAINDPGIKS